ncbi:STY4851/ECs_5259 family protein [Neiella holothuriorum]|uniref:STY4851/ECs_5259 family protein n=1 Tax=Neiella holothuriorum TaxID=2870530 RepID=UPI00298FDE0A|nr:STY4851/ECs_5259 family protein [Neiella holothuriorum]
MQSPSAWLKEFCLTRQDKIHSNARLYQLHMTQTEYRDLQLSLSRSRNFNNALPMTKEWCGAFTLYCAEWFRREYTQNWSWEPIYERLNFSLSASEVREVVPSGLCGYWGKTLSRYQQSNRNDYLGSLFKEGGLPSNLLSKNDNHYQKAFNSVFDRFHLVREFGDDAVNQYIHHKLSSLPESLQGNESIALVRGMVEKLDSFVHTYNLESQPEPVGYLEQNYPQWREVFPLPLDSETGTQFLSQLLSRATEEVRKVSKKRRDLKCKHYIDFTNQCVMSDVLLPLNCAFDIDALHLSSSRIELAIFEGERHLASLGTCFARFENEQTVVRIRQKVASVVRSSTDSELYLVALQSGRQLAQVRLTASTVDCDDSPLTLVESDDRWLVVGQATARTKAKRALVLLPFSSSHDVLLGHFEADESKRLRELNAFSLEGKVSVTLGNGDAFVITTGAESYADDVLTLKGDLLPWTSIPALTFKGVPSVASQYIGDVGFGLSTYLNGELAHQLAPSEVNGRQLLSVKNQGNQVLLRKRIGVLPADFDVQLIPGTTPLQGYARISTQSPFVATVPNSAISSNVTKPTPGVTELAISCSSNPPASFQLKIQASLLSEPIILNLPFPSSGMTAFDADGKPLSRRLAIDELLGGRINLFTQQGRPTRYQVTLLDVSRGNAPRNAASFKWDYMVVDKPVEVSLYGLHDYVLDLLSLSENIDSKVELSITGNGRTERFTISHYSTTMDYDYQRRVLTLNSRTLRDASGVKPMLLDISNPEQTPVTLNSRVSEGVATGEYELPHYIEEGGPWLVVPAESSKVSFRARFILGAKHSGSPQEINTLQKAARAFNPRDEVSSIALVLKQMADDWDHSGWAYLQQTWKRYQYLPMSTFEVWRHLARDPKALAVALFKFDIEANFVAKLVGQLPVIWEFIPLSYWLHAKHLFGRALAQLGIADDMKQSLQNGLIAKLTKEISSLSTSVADYLKQEQFTPPIPSQVMQPMIQGAWYQDLLRLHSDNENWPSASGSDLCQLCHTFELLPFELKVNSKFQEGVVYAPVFAAAVACGRIPPAILARFEHKTLFDFRQLKDFDHQWFEPMYSYVISHLMAQK